MRLATVPALGNYGEWARTVGGMLALAGLEGFLGNLAHLWSEADQSATEWEPFLRRLSQEMASETPFSVKRVADLVRPDRDGNAAAPSLLVALPGHLAELVRTDKFSVELGRALKKHVDKRYGDDMWRIQRAADDPHTKMARWEVRHGA